jgi:hypothetical protein
LKEHQQIYTYFVSTDFFTKLVPNPVENTEIQEENIKKSKGSRIMPKK